MHPELAQLAAYLDGALAPEARAQLRAHLLACPRCAAQLDLLRADSLRLAHSLAAGPLPDLRARLRGRLRRPQPLAWLLRGAALAGGLAALLLFALLIAGGTAGRAPDRLLVTDRQGGQVVALDPGSGARLAAQAVGPAPAALAYDSTRGRLYVAQRDAVAVLDAATLAVLDRWLAPQSIAANAGLALDARAGRLYLAQPDGVVVLSLDTPTLEVVQRYPLGAAVQSLALAPAGATLFALDQGQARLWSIGLPGGAAQAQTLAPPDSLRQGWLAIDGAGQALYILLTRAAPAGQPQLWRLAIATRAAEPLALDPAPPPWDLLLLDRGRLAIPRGDGAVGGVELLAGDPLRSLARLDAQHDQHHLVAGPGARFFGLNFSHNTITCYDADSGAVLWRSPPRSDWQPWDAVFVPGGRRWPWAG